MNSFTHLVVGFLAAYLAATGIYCLVPAPEGSPFASAFTAIMNTSAAAVIALGSLFPDVDHRKSRVFKTTLVVAFLASAFLAYNGVNFASIWRIAASISIGSAACGAIYVLKPRHRGATHSLLAAAAFSATVFVLLQSKISALLAFVAYASHLLADGGVKFA